MLKSLLLTDEAVLKRLSTTILLQLSFILYIAEVSSEVCRDAINNVNAVPNILSIATVQIVALFKVLICLPRVDTRSSQPRLDCVSVEVCSTVNVSVQLRANMPRSVPHPCPVLSYILCESTEMPHL